MMPATWTNQRRTNTTQQLCLFRGRFQHGVRLRMCYSVLHLLTDIACLQLVLPAPELMSTIGLQLD